MNRWYVVAAVMLGVLLGSPSQAWAGGPLLPGEKFAVGNSPYLLALSDLDGDAVLDVVTANYLSSDIGVLLGKGAAQPQPTLVPLLSVPIEGVLVLTLFALGVKATRRRGWPGRRAFA